MDTSHHQRTLAENVKRDTLTATNDSSRANSRMTAPRISIVTPSYRSGEWLPLCIESVADQQGVTVEHLVVLLGCNHLVHMLLELLQLYSLHLWKFLVYQIFQFLLNSHLLAKKSKYQ
jgi:hypothetical protein